MKKFLILGLILITIFLSFGISSSQSGQDLFQRALAKERAEGNLEEAIVLYQKVIDFSQDKALKAQAQLRIGLCYEKLGQKNSKQAQEAFQKVVDNYPTQKVEIAIAKERLSILSKALKITPQEPYFRKISVPVNLSQGVRLSPDGKKMTFSSSLYEGSMWIIPVQGNVSSDIAGEPSKLSGEGEVWTWGHVWSQDGKWIAYNCMKNEKDIFVDEIHIITSSGGEPKKISTPVNRGGGFHLLQYCLSLSPDGKVLAYSTREENKQGEPKQSFIYTVSVDGGAAKRLTGERTWLPSFSPDGKNIAYVKAYGSKGSKSGSDLWIIPSDGGKSVQVTDLGEDIWDSVWSPDGRMIALLRRPLPNEGINEIWIIPISRDRKSQGAPKKINLHLTSSTRLAGWTPDNRIGLLLQNPIHQAIYTVPSSGGKATQVTSAGTHPSWTPNGKRLFFYMEENICSSPAEGGSVSVIPISGNVQEEGWYSPNLSPDGKTVLFPATKKENPGTHIWTVPAKGGEATQITDSPGTDVFPSWSPDGMWIVFCRQQKKDDGKTYKTDLFLVPAEGGEERQLTFSPDEVERISAWSPDGKLIAYASGAKEIKTVSLEGSEPMILVKRQRGGGFTWSPDGNKIVYSDMGKIYMIFLDGGEPTEVKTGLEANVLRLSWSPDGKKIAFDARKGGDYEFYLMENFLPNTKDKK